MKKSLSILLALVMILSIFTVIPFSVSAEEVDLAVTGHTYASNWREWSQGGSDHGDQNYGMVAFGCWVVAMSKMMMETGIAPSGFNPDVLYWWERNNGYVPNTDYDISQLNGQYAPIAYAKTQGKTLEYVETKNDASDNDLWNYINNNYYVIIKVSNMWHYVYLDKNLSKSTGTLYVMESYTTTGTKGSVPFHSSYPGVGTAYVYKYYGSAPVDPTPQGHVMSESEGAGKTIPNGDYWICSQIAQDYFIDIPLDNFDTKNYTNLQTWIWGPSFGYVPTAADAFHFEYLNNGFYRITQYNTNMAVDVSNAALERGTNIQLFASNGSNAQQWSVEKIGGGYKIRCRCNNYYMDIDKGQYSGGTNVHTWEAVNDVTQVFSFIPYDSNERPLLDGVYNIGSSLKETCFLDVESIPGRFVPYSNVQIWNSPDDRFRLEYVGDGYYRIYEATSGLAMEVIDDNSNYLFDNKNVVLNEKKNSRGQYWKIRQNTDGTFSIINKLSGYYLNVNNGSTDDATNVQLKMYNNTSAQKWYFKKVIQDTEAVILGDVDGDEDVSILDVTVIQRHLATMEIPTFNEAAADVDGDEEVTIIDATLLQRHLAGMAVPVEGIGAPK